MVIVMMAENGVSHESDCDDGGDDEVFLNVKLVMIVTEQLPPDHI